MQKRQFALELMPCFARLIESDFDKADRCAWQRAGQCGQVCGNDVADLRVSADGLAFGEKNDRRAVGRNLDGSTDNRL